MYSAQRSATAGFTANQLIDEIRVNLAAPPACDASLAASGKTFNPAAVNPLSPLVLTIGAQVRTLSVGQELEPGLTLTRLDLIKNAQVPVQDVKIKTGAGVQLMRKYVAHVVVQIQKDHKIASTSPPIFIPVTVLIPAAGTAIYSCGGQSVLQETCEDLNSIWDATAPPGQECKPAGGCKYGGSFSASDAPADSRYVNDMTGGYNCPAGYTAQRSGSITVTGQCGKRCVTNNYFPTYECMMCNQSDGSIAAIAATLGMYANDSTNFEPDATAATTAVDGTTGNVTGVAVDLSVPPAPTATPATGMPTCDYTTNGTSYGGQTCVCYTDPYGGYSSCFWYAPPTPTPTPAGCPGCYTGTCFVPGTQVRMADGTTKSIEDVESGDKILAYDDVGDKPFATEIVKPIHHEARWETLYEITLEDGRQITPNGIHPIYVIEFNRYLSPRYFLPMFLAGQPISLKDVSGRPVRIVNMRVYRKFTPMYNLEVSPIAEWSEEYKIYGRGHTYLVEDIMVHNAMVTGTNPKF
jgi:hypothetical protein